MSKKFLEETRIHFRDHDPNATALTHVGCSTAWIDMSDYHRCTCLIFRTVGTGKVTDAGMYTATDAAGTGVTLVGSLTGSTNCTGSLVDATAAHTGSQAIGIVALDITHDEVAAALSGGQYVCAKMSCATNTDEWGAIYILSEPRYAKTTNVNTGNAGVAFA